MLVFDDSSTCGRHTHAWDKTKSTVLAVGASLQTVIPGGFETIGSKAIVRY